MNILLRSLFSSCLIYTISLFSNAEDRTLTYVETKSALPAGVKIASNENEAYFEFCPDNTCDLIRAKPLAAEDDLLDLGYLYVYYFSDYNDLENWRKRDSTGIVAKKILAKEKYSMCQEVVELDQAKCILNYLVSSLKGSLYFVRYDEDGRHYEAAEFPGEE